MTPPAVLVSVGDASHGTAVESGGDRVHAGVSARTAWEAGPIGDVEVPGADVRQAPSPQSAALAEELGTRTGQTSSPRASSSATGPV
jgi:hypothetical protein